MARIYLYRAGAREQLYALVDDEDRERISRVDWEVQFRGDGRAAYAKTNSSRIGKDHRLMHRMILRAPFGVAVDHIDGDGLNNRKSNLRFATISQNAQNSFVQIRDDKTSRFKGVSWNGKAWAAQIRLEGQTQLLGAFSDEVEAARAYDAAAIRLFKEFARTNEMMGLYDGKAVERRVFHHRDGEVAKTPVQNPEQIEPWQRLLGKKPLHARRLHRLRARANAAKTRSKSAHG